MGLDQYAHRRIKGSEQEIEIAYWRKHNRLQGWMENLWLENGNTGTFNCERVPLTIENVEALEKAISNKELPETQGFFFGSDSYEDYEEWGYKDQDMKFISAAREAIENGDEVFYSSWW